MDRIGNINIIQVVDVAGNGNMVRIGIYYRNRKIIPETEILNICSKRKLIPESEMLNIVRIGNEFRNRKFNRKRIVRISIGRGLPDEAQHEARPSPSKPSAPHKQPRQAQRKARPSRPWQRAQRAQRAQELRGLVARVGLAAWAAARTHAHGRPIVAAVCVCVSVCVHARFLKHAEFG